MARIVITRRVPPPAFDLFRAAGYEIDAFDSGLPPPRADLLRRAAGAAAVLATITERVDAEFLAAAGPGLRIVANFAVGYDNIDVPACVAAGVSVTNTPDVLTDATADLTWALILAAARRVGEGERLVRSGSWTGWTPSQLLGLELRGATLGIVGAGRIGTAVGLRAVGFGMHVIYANSRKNQVLASGVSAEQVGLPELLAKSDVVSLHTPMRPENRHMIAAPQLALLKPTAILVNTARGPLVDETALIGALREHRLAAAGLDVYEHEPRLAPGLAELPNVVLLPHLGSATHATRERMSRMAADNILAVLAGGAPLNPVR